MFALGYNAAAVADAGSLWLALLGLGVMASALCGWVLRKDPPAFAEAAPPASEAGAPASSDAAHVDPERFAQLQEIARQDPLTGALNRSEFRKIVVAALTQCAASSASSSSRSPSSGVVLFVDLDDFKAVNDTHGHFRGDALLQTCARRLEMIGETEMAALNRSDAWGDEALHRLHVARFGGDEFAAFIEGPIAHEDLERILRRTLKALTGDIHLGGRTISISASLGAAFLPDHGDSFDELMMAADAAMYSAKAGGKNRFEIYNARLDAKTRQEALEESELTSAIARGELEFLYQPIFDLRTSKIASAEALVRWKHPENGTLKPDEFFGALHRARLARPFHEWCIGEVIRTIGALNKRGTPLMIAANVSPEQLANLEFIALIKSHLEFWDCPAHLLQIEVTEDAAMREPELTMASLNKLHELGVTLAVDDFGVGYSNLVSLTRLPLSRLKVDRSLLLALDKQPAAFVLMQTVINLANSLGFHSVVEGIETDNQLQMIQSMGADFAQGFLLSRPVSLQQLMALMAASDIVAGTRNGQDDQRLAAFQRGERSTVA
ncbi:MAG: bifunctional diguanylate cyclase/phosphodiesterase [Pseudomonadota bacterium]